MKKNLLFLACFAFATPLLAQENPEPTFKLPKTLLKFTPLQLFLQTFELGTETFNSTYSKSFNVSAGVRTGSESYDKGLGANLELGYRKYPAPMKFRSRNGRDSYQGIYYSLFVRGEYFKGDYSDYYYGGSQPTDYSEKVFSVAPGFTIGFQKTLWQIIVLDVYIGGGVKFSDVQSTSSPDYNPYYSIFDPGYTGIYPKTGVKIGIGF